MSNEEVERAIDFLLKSQANLEAQCARTDERVSRLVEQVSQVTEQVAQLKEQLSSFADTQANIMRVMTQTLESQARINESFRSAIGEVAARQSRLEEAIVRLADSQAQSDRRLDALMKIVEEGRSGTR
jgi:chaperonin cofactor prefoldin